VNLAGIGIFGARLQYPIFSDGSIFGFNDAPAIAAKRAQKDALAWTAHLTREEVIDRVTQTFLATVSARNRVPSIERRVTLLEQAVAITREELARGLLLPIDLKVVTEQLNGAQSLSKVIHQNAVAGSLEMARLLGLPSASDVRLVSTLPEPPEPPSAVQLLGASLNQHPLLEVQRANVDKAKQDYRLERFRLYPSVSLTGSAHYLSDFDHNAHVYIGAITVGVPIFDFGAQLATVRAKKAQYFAEQARLGSVADDVTNDVVKIYEQIDALSVRILTLQGESAKLDRDARVAAAEQQQGVKPLLPSIDAELHLLDKRDELNVLETSRLLLYAALQKATGGTWKWLP
jgi:outer membrane protein TolC